MSGQGRWSSSLRNYDLCVKDCQAACAARSKWRDGFLQGARILTRKVGSHFYLRSVIECRHAPHFVLHECKTAHFLFPSSRAHQASSSAHMRVEVSLTDRRMERNHTSDEPILELTA